ncbi:hypothetical protein Q9R20_11050 [Microbacterium sp. PRF11]|uniref:hypothetical protein n=1 Tax=Microbacterium sp. PRF11 TaxID=2962593 RepID=UPI0028812C5F|nr:hypothetical protein [Microbacterium sp. PRF11]MDT0117526.1 hypothetical protein [Microbacterium sp. PRF11]
MTFTLDRGTVPCPRSFGSLLAATRDAFDGFLRQPELAGYWLPQWERKPQTSFQRAWFDTVDEVGEILSSAAPAWALMYAAGGDRDQAIRGYGELVRILRLDDKTVRGSGTLTAATALLLASAFPDHPAQSAQIAAAHLHTDTDTIGTMAAAIVGAAAPRDLFSPVLDADYLASEAHRLHAIAMGRPVDVFPYPDLLRWEPPRSAIDAVGLDHEGLTLAGLSRLRITREAAANKDGIWVWARTSFGQSVLVKHRLQPRPLPPGNVPLSRQDREASRGISPSARVSDTSSSARPATVSTQPRLFDDLLLEPVQTGDPSPESAAHTVEELLEQLERTGYRNADLGQALRTLATRPDTDAINRFVLAVTERLRSPR